MFYGHLSNRSRKEIYARKLQNFEHATLMRTVRKEAGKWIVENLLRLL